MTRTLAALVVLAASFTSTSALACGMYIPDDSINLAELIGEIDDAKVTEKEPTVIEKIEVKIEPVKEPVPAAPTVVEVEEKAPTS